MSVYSAATPYPAQDAFNPAASFSGILNRFHQIHPETVSIKNNIHSLSQRAMDQSMKLDTFQENFPFNAPRTEIKGVSDVLKTVSRTLTKIHSAMLSKPYTVVSTPDFDFSTTNKDLSLYLDEVEDCFKIIKKASDPTKKILKPQFLREHRTKQAVKRFQVVKLQLSLLRIVLDAATAHNLKILDSDQCLSQQGVSDDEQVDSNVSEWLNGQDGVYLADSPSSDFADDHEEAKRKKGRRGFSLREKVRGSSVGGVVTGVLRGMAGWKPLGDKKEE